MASVSTEWILNLGGNIRESIKKVVGNVQESIDSVKDLGTNWGLTEKKTKAALKNEELNLRETRKELTAKERTLKDLEKAYKKAAPGVAWSKAKKAVEDQQKEIDKLKEKLWNASENAKTLKEDLENFAKIKTDWSSVAIQANQMSEIVGKITTALDFAVDVKKLRDEFQRLTDLSGSDLDKFLSKSREIADVYDEDAKAVGEAANALTQQMGGSFESNLNLLEEGLKRGANLNGDYLAILKRYAPTLHEMGVSADEATALIATAAKKGIDPSNFIEGIQKAGIELRKLDKPAEDTRPPLIWVLYGRSGWGWNRYFVGLLIG